MAKIKIELNKEDIRKILSEKYGVDIKDVNLEAYTTYHYHEGEVTYVNATVAMDYTEFLNKKEAK